MAAHGGAAEAIPIPSTASRLRDGATLYSEYCAGCHGANGRSFSAPAGTETRECIDPNEKEDDLYGPQVGKITRDRLHRHRSCTGSIPTPTSSRVNLGTVYAGYPHRYCHYRKTFGYANMPLDGIWLRAPYLHNGSVPTLRDLLEPPAIDPNLLSRQRRLRPDAGRLRSDAGDAGRARVFRVRHAKPGNSNSGHEGKRYGTELTPAEKDALVEFMKTF